MDHNSREEAITKAFDYIARRPHSVFELSSKLRKRKYEEPTIKHVVQRLIEMDYLDDLKFARAFAKHHITIKRQGRQKLRLDLIKRGVAEHIIEEVLTLYPNEEMESVRALAEKKWRQLERRDLPVFDRKQRLMRFLISRGFTSQVTIETVEWLMQKETSSA